MIKKEGTASQAFPSTETIDKNGDRSSWFDPGLNKREYAAIHLRVPDSGVDWLDAMIRESNFNATVTKIAQAQFEYYADNPKTLAFKCREIATALLEKK